MRRPPMPRPARGNPNFGRASSSIRPMPTRRGGNRTSTGWTFESVAHAVREWAIAHGDDPRYRICVAGYEGEHAFPDSWAVVDGKGGRGHGYGGQPRRLRQQGRERLWFSPHCICLGATEPAAKPKRRRGCGTGALSRALSPTGRHSAIWRSTTTPADFEIQRPERAVRTQRGIGE